MTLAILKAKKDFPQWEFSGKVFSRDGYTLMECYCSLYHYEQIGWLYCFERNAIGLFADTFDFL